MKEGCLILALIIFSSQLFGDELKRVSFDSPVAKLGTTGFMSAYGSSGQEFGCSVVEKNGYFFGATTSQGFTSTTDFLLFKTDIVGNLKWRMTLGGTHREILASMLKTKDDEVLILGDSSSLFHTPLKIFNPNRPVRSILIKLASSNEVVWATDFDRPEGAMFVDVFSAENKDIYLPGNYTEGDSKSHLLLLAKLNSEGKLLWAKKLSRSKHDFAYSVRQTRDNNFVLIGSSENDSVSNPILLKFDSSGRVIWSKSYKLNQATYCFRVYESLEGGFFLFGKTKRVDASELCLLKLNMQGDLEWIKSYHGSKEEICGGFLEQKDGGLLLISRSSDRIQGKAVITEIRADKLGNLLSFRAFGGGSFDAAVNTIFTQEGGLLSVGTTTSFGSGKADVLVLKNQLQDIDGGIGKNFYEVPISCEGVSQVLSFSEFITDSHFELQQRDISGKLDIDLKKFETDSKLKKSDV